jgi:hypothetical protein
LLGRAGIVIGSVALVAGCSTSTPSTSGAPVPAPVAASDTANGKTMRLAVSQKLVVTLNSTYWQFGSPSDLSVINPDGMAVAAACADPPPYPGSGCGTVTQEYHAVRTGTTVLNAGRNSCGEALACSPAQSSWKLTVLVR